MDSIATRKNINIYLAGGSLVYNNAVYFTDSENNWTILLLENVNT